MDERREQRRTDPIPLPEEFERRGGDRRRPWKEVGGWKFEKTVNFSHIIFALSLVGCVIGYLSTVEKRFTILDQINVAQQATNKDNAQAQDDIRREMRDGRHDLNQKFDQLINVLLRNKK